MREEREDHPVPVAAPASGAVSGAVAEGMGGGAAGDGRGVQYFSRSELPGREVALHRFSLRRKSTLVALCLLLSVVLTAATAVSAVMVVDVLASGLVAHGGRAGAFVVESASLARWRTLVLAGGAVAAMAATVALVVRSGPRIVALESWVRRMGAGDLTHTVVPTGSDEITELFYDLEVLRRQSVRAQQLDLVQDLSAELLEKNDELESVVAELRDTQDQVVSRQKLAELGALTAGVAHEIRNPLNLIQNFSRTSQSMMQELRDTLAEMEGAPTAEETELLEELVAELTDNMQRIREHGDRANRIVQDMLAMGRGGTGVYHTVSLNQLVEDHSLLAYHSARGRDPEFNLRIVREYDDSAGEVTVVSEDIGRVVLNLVSNSCYAVSERAALGGDYQPTLWLSTAAASAGWVEVRVRDNGPGIPPEVMQKIFNPFFTTKPTDRGTGLGLSLSNDIVREHGGSLSPRSVPGDFTEFTLRLPRARPTAFPGSGAPEAAAAAGEPGL